MTDLSPEEHTKRISRGTYTGLITLAILAPLTTLYPVYNLLLLCLCFPVIAFWLSDGLIACILFETVSELEANSRRRLFKATLPAIAAILVSFGWGYTWHNHLNPVSRCEKLVDKIHTAIKISKQEYGKLPKIQQLAEALDLNNGDPHNLAKHYDKESRSFVDVWDNPIQYTPSRLGLYGVYSYGPNGVNDRGSNDDISSGWIVTKDPDSSFMDSVKGLFKRNKDEEPSDSEGD